MNNKLQSLKVLVVEDESLIAEMVRVMLEDMGYEVPFVAYNYRDGLRVLEEEDVEFAVFDINLKGGNEGIDLGKVAQSKGVPFMFLTSYSDHRTIDLAKETKPGAYVIKPFSEEELYSGIQLSLMHLGERGDDLITIKDGHRNLVIKVDEIVFAKAENVYVEIHTLEKRFLIRQSLSAFVKQLPKSDFIRVHRSYVVNRKYITTHSKSALSVNDHEIPISRSYKEEVLHRLSD